MRKRFLPLLYVVIFLVPVVTLAEQPVFKLPYPADSMFNHLCTQGNNELPTHIFDTTRFDLDFDTPNFGPGDPEDVLAAATGFAYRFDGCFFGDASCNFGFGNHVKIDHGNGIFSIYAHLEVVTVGNGVLVKQGDVIGKEGSTGDSISSTGGRADHIHFGVHTGDPTIPHPGASIPTEQLEVIDRTANTGIQIVRGDEIICGIPGVDPIEGHIYDSSNMSGTPVDIYFLVDLSASFIDDLPVFKAQAPEVISTLKASSPNIRFGLGKYEDYPINPFGNIFFGDKAYEQLTDLTFDTDLVLAIINSLFTRDGGDIPQSQLTALFQAATGAGQDLSGIGFPEASIPPGQQTNFRDGAMKLFLLWTDAPFHQPGDPGDIPYPGPSFNETVNAILALDPPKVIGISSGTDAIPNLEAIAAATDSFAPPGGVDCNSDGIIDIFEGEPLVCSISSSGEGIGDAVLAIIEAALESPIAEAGGPYDGTVGSLITFDASGSFDPDGDIISYEWDFEDDGIFDEATTSAIISHTYDEEFSGIAFLRVTDNDGLSAIDIASVEVIAPSNGGDGIGCSIAQTSTSISIPIYILLPIFVVIMRVWKYCKKDYMRNMKRILYYVLGCLKMSLLCAIAIMETITLKESKDSRRI